MLIAFIAIIASLAIAWPLAVISWSLPARCFDPAALAQAPLAGVLIVTVLPLFSTLWAFPLVPPTVLPWTVIMGWMLICLATIDARTFILPHCLTWPLLAMGILQAIGSTDPAAAGAAIGLERLLAACLGYAFMASIAWLFKMLRGKEGLGLGDASLLAAAGAWLGLAALPSVILLASFAALAVTVTARWLEGTRRDLATRPLPFGPYLAAGMWIVALHGPIGLG